MAADNKAKTGQKLIATNRKAHFNYFLSDYLEAGISLTGTEIKSIRQGHCSLTDSYVLFRHNEAFVVGMDISIYEQGNIFNHDPKRDRKLLLHKKEIRDYQRKAEVDGYTVVVTRVYLKKGRAKVEIALGKGKDAADKRDTIKKRDVERNLKQIIKNHNG